MLKMAFSGPWTAPWLVTDTSRAFWQYCWRWWLRWPACLPGLESWGWDPQGRRNPANSQAGIFGWTSELIGSIPEEKPRPCTKLIMSLSFSTERPKDAGCHLRNETSATKRAYIIGVIVQVSRSLQFRHAITHHCNIYSNHSACSQFFGHVMQCLFANLTLLHCRPLPCGSSFIAARLNAAVCSLRLERWWLGPVWCQWVAATRATSITMHYHAEFNLTSIARRCHKMKMIKPMCQIEAIM